MTNVRQQLKLAIAVAFAFAGATSAQAYTGTVTSNATIVTPITITATPLEFGSISAGASAGTITLSAAASPSPAANGGAALVNQGTARAAAKIDLAASAAENNFGVSVASLNGVTATLTSGGNTMTVDTFTNSAAAALDATGKSSFYIGGTLHVGASQAAGVYTGNFSVTVDYQ